MRAKETNQQGFIIPLIIVIIVVALVIILWPHHKKNDNSTTKSTPASTKAGKETVGQSDAEKYCQDANLLSKYLDLKTVSVVDAGNYSVQYQDDGATYDKDGYPIKDLQWNGKDKTTGKAARFSCWVSGKKDGITLHWLTRDGADLFGSADFAQYDKAGKQQ